MNMLKNTLKYYLLIMVVTIFVSCSFSQKPTSEELRSRAIDLVVEGEKQESLGEYVVAIKIYDESLGISTRPRAYYDLGHSYMKLDEYEKAIPNFEKAIELVKNYRIAQTELDQAKELLKTGKVSMRFTDTTSQVASIEPTTLKPIESTPLKTDADVTSSFSPYAQISDSQQTTPPEPLEPVQESEKKEEKPIPTVEQVNEYLQKHLEETKVSYDPEKFGKDTRIVLDNSRYHKEKARKYVDAKRYDYAIIEYKEALKLNPNDSESVVELSAVYEKMGNIERSLALLKDVEEKEPNNPKVFFSIGNMKRANGDYDEAMKYYNRALKLDPANPVILNHIGYVYKKLVEYDKAENAYLQAIVASPQYVNSYINIGILYDDFLNDDEKALFYYKKYLELGGDRKAEVNKWIMDIEKKQGAKNIDPM